MTPPLCPNFKNQNPPLNFKGGGIMKADYGNLSKGERESLINWRKTQLFNPCGDLVLQSQDKGNRFVTVDKKTGKLKAEEQIKRSSFVKLNLK